MKVFTYHEDLTGYPDCKELLNLWSESWQRHGWEPQILTRSDAASHPLYQELFDTVVRLPTVLPKEYEFTVFMRWLAMANIGGGLMVDNDVINYGYRPRDLVCECCPPVMPSRPVCIEPHKVPCAIFASADGHEMLVRSCIEASKHCERITHLSDMQIITQLELETRPIVVSVFKPGWKEAYLVHYAWQAVFDETQTRPVLKAEIIKKERPL